MIKLRKRWDWDELARRLYFARREIELVQDGWDIADIISVIKEYKRSL